MMFQNWRLLPWLSLIPLIIAVSCASPRAPTGGDVDVDPPRLIPEESTPNQQTNFNEKEVIITFDEWFTLKDVLSQLVISPLMPEEPEVKQKGKSLYITLPDSLKEETTYTINFGSAIADLNEGNVLENFAFVFSTGDILDSVSLGGKVIDAVTLLPVKDALVMLHPASEDSAVYTIKPEYVAKTDEEGKWKLSNIRSDSFQVIALVDGNLNFLYDLETEYFGWYDDVLVTDIPKALLPDIYVFPKVMRKSIADVVHENRGWIKVVVAGAQSPETPEFLPPLTDPVIAWDGDTVHYWYAPDQNYQGNVFIADDTVKVDGVRPSKNAEVEFNLVNRSGKLMPGMNVRLYSPVPIVSIDTAKISFVVDSMEQVPYRLESDSLDQRLLLLKGSLKPNANHLLTLLPGAIVNVLGAENDTLMISVPVADVDAFGDLTLKAGGMEADHQYIVRLLSGENEIALDLVSGQTDTVFVYKRLLPGKYQVEMIEDLNNNGNWDSGDFQTRRQPERKMIFELESLRAAWEVESTISWK